LIQPSPANYIVKQENMRSGATNLLVQQQLLPTHVTHQPLVQLAHRKISCALALLTGLQRFGPADRQQQGESL
jgi:hypothetical protein